MTQIYSSGGVMTLKPSYLNAFLKTFSWIFTLIVIFSGFVPYALGEDVRLVEVLALAMLGSAFTVAAVVVMFTPREITWDEENIRIRAIFPGSGEWSWKQLEAYSCFGRRFGTFLIKFEGQQAFQIVPSGFCADEWKMFQSLLRQRFPEKKTSIWLGPLPVRFGKK